MASMSLENNLEAFLCEAESTSESKRAGLLKIVRALVNTYDFSVAELGITPFSRKNPIFVPQELDGEASLILKYSSDCC